MTDYRPWTSAEAAGLVAVPGIRDDKYSRGVLGVVTGSVEYPGAAVLGVEAALHTGLGMVRYLGPEPAARLVLARRPEAVTVPGRVQAWLLGSGMDAAARSADTAARLHEALASGAPLVLDAGALDLAGESAGPVVLTPHAGELARLLDADVAEIAASPAEWAERAADALGATVLLKGHTSFVAGPGGRFRVEASTSWLATAGTGDALAGILGALVATHAEAVAAEEGLLTRLAATAAVLHGLAAERAGAGGPFTVLGLCSAIPGVVARWASGGDGASAGTGYPEG